MLQSAGVFECRSCGRTWVDELPELWEDYWPHCCHAAAWLLRVLVPSMWALVAAM